MICDLNYYRIELSFFVPEALTEPDPAYQPNTYRRIKSARLREMLDYPRLFPCAGGYVAEVLVRFEGTPRAEVMAGHNRIVEQALAEGLTLEDCT